MGVLWIRDFGPGAGDPGPVMCYFVPQVVSPTPEAQRLVPSENVEQKKPARQSASPEQVPHSSVEAQDDSAPITKAAMSAKTRLGVIWRRKYR
jgi:hypothetical protein